MSAAKTDTVNISTSFPPIQSFSWNAEPKGLKYIETESDVKIKKGKKTVAAKKKGSKQPNAESKHTDTKAEEKDSKSDAPKSENEADAGKEAEGSPDAEKPATSPTGHGSPSMKRTDCGSPKMDPNRYSTAIPRRPKHGCVSKLTMDILKWRMPDSESFARSFPPLDDELAFKPKEMNTTYPRSPTAPVHRYPPRKLPKKGAAGGRWADPAFLAPKDQHWVLEDGSKKRSLHDGLSRTNATDPSIQSNFIPADPTPPKDIDQPAHPPAAVVLATTKNSARRSNSTASQVMARAQLQQQQMRDDLLRQQQQADDQKRQQIEFEQQLHREHMERIEGMEWRERETLETHFAGQLTSMGSELVELQEKLHRDALWKREGAIRDNLDCEWILCVEILWRRILRELEFNERRRIIATLRTDLNNQDVFTHLQIALRNQETNWRKQIATGEAQERTNLLRSAACQYEELEARSELRVTEMQRRRDELLALDTALNNLYVREACREEEEALRSAVLLAEDRERYYITRLHMVNQNETGSRGRIEGTAESEFQQLAQEWGEMNRFFLGVLAIHDGEQYGRGWLAVSEEQTREHIWRLKTLLGTESTQRLTLQNSQAQAFQLLVRAEQENLAFCRAVSQMVDEESSRRAFLVDEYTVVVVNGLHREHAIIEQEFVQRLTIVTEDSEIRNRLTYERANAWTHAWQRREVEKEEETNRHPVEREEALGRQAVQLQYDECDQRIAIALDGQSMWISLRHAHRILLDGIVVFLEAKRNLLHEEKECRKTLITEAMLELYRIYMNIRDEHRILGLEIRQTEQRKIIQAYEAEEWDMTIKKPFETQRPLVKAILRSTSAATNANTSTATSSAERRTEGQETKATGNEQVAERREIGDTNEASAGSGTWLGEWQAQESQQRELVVKAEAMFFNTVRVTERAERSLLLMAAGGAPVDGLKVSPDDWTWALQGITQREVKARLALMITETNARNDLTDRQHIAREGLLPPHTAARRHRAAVTIQCAWRMYFAKKVVRLLRELRSKQDRLQDDQYRDFMEMLLRKAAMSPTKQSKLIDITPSKPGEAAAAPRKGSASQPTSAPAPAMTQFPSAQMPMGFYYMPMMMPQPASTEGAAPNRTLFPGPDSQPMAPSSFMAFMPFAMPPPSTGTAPGGGPGMPAGWFPMMMPQQPPPQMPSA